MQGEEISIQIQEDDGVQVITLVGSLSDQHTQSVRDAVHTSLDNDPAEVILEVSDVDYISSSGIGMLVSIHKRCNSEDRQLVLCGLSAELLELFALTRLDQVFTIAESVDAWREAHTR